MYDINSIFMYSLLIFGIMLLMFPNQIKDLEKYTNLKIFDNREFVAILALLMSLYLFLSTQDLASDSVTTISSSLPSEVSSSVSSSKIINTKK